MCNSKPARHSLLSQTLICIYLLSGVTIDLAGLVSGLGELTKTARSW